jgi:hypothetical protein
MGNRSDSARTEFDRWAAAADALERPVATVLIAAIPAQSAGVRALVEAALREAGVPQEPRHELARRASEAWRAGPAPTLALALSPDPGAEAVALPVPFTAPELVGAYGARARYGEPWTTPVRLALLARPRTVALFVDAARVRRFDAEGGVVREVDAAIRPLDTSDWRPMREEAMGMPGTPARGGAGTDLYEARTAVWTERFWSRVAQDLANELSGEGEARVFVLGGSRAVAAFERAWPAGSADRLVARPGAPVDPDADAGAWTEAIATMLEAEEETREVAALEAVAERGVVGPAATWTALRAGRVGLLVLPADREVAAAWDAATQEVRDLPDGLPEGATPDATVERIDLREHVASHLERQRTALRFARGVRADELEARYRGVAGVLRR